MKLQELCVAFAGLVVAAQGLRFSADSKAGQKLLRSATVEVEPERHLADNQNWNLGAMYIKYEGCSSFQDRGDDYYTYWQEYNNNNAKYGYNNNNNNNNNNRQYNNYNFKNYNGNGNGNGNRQLEDYYGNKNYNNNNDNGLQMVNLVRFTLCYDSGCGSCTGRYAIDMMTFLYAYDEHTQTLLQGRCEGIRQRCYCDQNQNQYYNNNQEYYEQKCYNSCYSQAGLSECKQFDNYDGQDEEEQFVLNDYLGCKEMDYYPSGYADYQVNNANGAGYYNNPNQYWDNSIFYVGPYCKDASEIYLGTFMDQQCSYAATHATFTSNYKTKNGESFPYFQTPIVASQECISCQDEEEVLEMENGNGQQGNNNNGNQYMQRSYYYYAEQQNQQEELQTNELCGYVEEGDEDILVSCVYGQNGNGNGNGNGNDNNNAQKNYAGCSYLDMLPKLDGRYKNSVSDITDKLKLQDSYSVVLAVLALIMVMTICLITMCNPSSITERKARLLDIDEEPSQLNAMPRDGDSIEPALTSVGVEAIAD